MGTCVRMSAMSSSSVAIRTLAISWSRSSKSVSSKTVDLSEAEMPPSLSGMSWMVKNSIGGVGELCGAVAPACMSSISFSVLHDRRPRIQAAANKAEGQRQSYQALLFRANAARNELCVRIMEDHFVMFGHREQLGRSDLLAVDD